MRTLIKIKKKFVSNLEDFEKKNKNTINYILEVICFIV